MYLGRVVEVGEADAVFKSPLHPYTQALLRAAPQMRLGRRSEKAALAGELPSPMAIPAGCPFHRDVHLLSSAAALKFRLCMPGQTDTKLSVTSLTD